MRWGSALAGLALATTLAGCGGDTFSVDPVAAAATATADAGSARIESTSTTTFSGGGFGADGQLVTRASGVVDYRKDRSATTYRVEGGGHEQTMRVITLGRVSYSEVPQDLAAGGKRWMRVDEADLMDDFAAPERVEEDGSSSGIIVFAGGDIGAGRDPARILDYLRDVGSGTERVGEERVRGVATERYATRVDLRRALRRDLTDEGWPDRSIDRAVEWVAAGAVTVDVWVDDDGLVRRLRWTQKEEVAGAAIATEHTTELFDFGVEVDVRAPPADQVAEWRDFIAWENDADGFAPPAGD